MSHIVTIKGLKIQAEDLDCLEKAGNHLGLEMVDKQTFRYYGGETGVCYRTLVHKEASYEIGVVLDKDGTYSLQWDPIDYNLTKAVGENANLLRQRFTVELSKKEYEPQGYRVWEETDTNGRPVVYAEI